MIESDAIHQSVSIASPFAENDSEKDLSKQFLENGFRDSREAEPITRHQLNGLGYLATLSRWQEEMCIPNDTQVGAEIGGYPLGAIKACISETGEYREYICCKENNINEPPLSESVPPIDQKNFWRPTKGYWNTIATLGYYMRDLYSGGNILARQIGSITREDEERHTRAFPIAEGMWVRIIRTISNWDALTSAQRKSRYPMGFVDVSYGDAKSYRCLAIPFCAGKEVVRWIPFPKGRTLTLTIQGDNVAWPHASTSGEVVGFGSFSLQASGRLADRFSYAVNV